MDKVSEVLKKLGELYWCLIFDPSDSSVVSDAREKMKEIVRENKEILLVEFALEMKIVGENDGRSQTKFLSQSGPMPVLRLLMAQTIMKSLS